jgi:hypothetical protein
MRLQASRALAGAALTCLLALWGAAVLSAQPSSRFAGADVQTTQPLPQRPSVSSAQLFEQIYIVLKHPRCMNCHTGEAFPRQGDDAHRHTMNVTRGPADHGAPGLHCSTCHQSVNQAASGVPGAPDWSLAPMRMTWQGLNAGELCRALRNPAKGAMTPEQMLPHFATGLIRWAWAPGMNSHGRARSIPPISYAQFVDVTRRWIASGARCPE